MRVEAEKSVCAFYRDLVVPDVAEMVDIQRDFLTKLFFYGEFHHIGYFTDGMIARSDVEDAAYRFIGFNCACIGHGSVFDAQEWAPDRGVADVNDAILHGAFEHGVDDQSKAHARAVSGNCALAESDYGELGIDHLHYGAFSL